MSLHANPQTSAERGRASEESTGLQKKSEWRLWRKLVEVWSPGRCPPLNRPGERRTEMKRMSNSSGLQKQWNILKWVQFFRDHLLWFPAMKPAESLWHFLQFAVTKVQDDGEENVPYVSLVVQFVVGELQLVETDHLPHPGVARRQRVRVDVGTGRNGRVGVPGHHPLGAVVHVPVREGRRRGQRSNPTV